MSHFCKLTTDHTFSMLHIAIYIRLLQAKLECSGFSSKLFIMESTASMHKTVAPSILTLLKAVHAVEGISLSVPTCLIEIECRPQEVPTYF